MDATCGFPTDDGAACGKPIYGTVSVEAVDGEPDYSTFRVDIALDDRSPSREVGPETGSGFSKPACWEHCEPFLAAIFGLDPDADS